MTEIIPHQFPTTGQAVRTVLINDEPWFVAADVCAVLDLHTGRALARIDEDEKGVRPTQTPGGIQSLAYVNEPGLYALVLGSRKPEAKAFKRWITHDVLPAIRRTGSYSVQHQVPKTFAEALLLAAELEINRSKAVQRAEQAETRVAELEPAAQAWDTLASADGDYSVREAAFILNRDPAINTGQQRLFAKIREFGMVSWGDVPYAQHAKHLRLRPRTYTNPRTGEERDAKPQLRVTYEGLKYLHRRLGGQHTLRLDMGGADEIARAS